MAHGHLSDFMRWLVLGVRLTTKGENKPETCLRRRDISDYPRVVSKNSKRKAKISNEFPHLNKTIDGLVNSPSRRGCLFPSRDSGPDEQTLWRTWRARSSKI